MAGSVRVTGATTQVPVVVDINTTGTPTELAAFSDSACTQSVSLPATITMDTTFYVRQTGAVVLSVKVGGTELAGARVFLSNAGPVTFPIDADSRNVDVEHLLSLVSSRLGASAAATTLGTVVGKIQVFDQAGVSAGYLPVYDALT